MKRKFCAAAMLTLSLSGCAMPSPPPQPLPHGTRPQPICAAGEMMVQTTLWFGLNRPHGAPISAAEWQNFVDKEVTPRFSDGLSVIEGNGQWMGKDGTLAREKSRALLLIHGMGAENQEKIEALRTIYKQRFQQESVMRVDQPACVGF